MKKKYLLILLILIITLVSSVTAGIVYFINNRELSDIEFEQDIVSSYKDRFAFLYMDPTESPLENNYIYYWNGEDILDTKLPKDEIPFLSPIFSDGQLYINTIDFDTNITVFGVSSSLNYRVFTFDPETDQELKKSIPVNTNKSEKQSSSGLRELDTEDTFLWYSHNDTPDRNTANKRIENFYIRESIDIGDDTMIFSNEIDILPKTNIGITSNIYMSPSKDKFIFSRKSDCSPFVDNENVECSENEDLNELIYYTIDTQNKTLEQNVLLNEKVDSIIWRNLEEVYIVQDERLYLLDINNPEEKREIYLEIGNDKFIDDIAASYQNLTRDQLAITSKDTNSIYIYDGRKEELRLVKEFDEFQHVIGWKDKDSLYISHRERSGDDSEDSFKNMGVRILDINSGDINNYIDREYSNIITN